MVRGGRVILTFFFMNLKLWGGGEWTNYLEGVNMLEAPIFIKKHSKTESITLNKGGGVVS